MEKTSTTKKNESVWVIHEQEWGESPYGAPEISVSVYKTEQAARDAFEALRKECMTCAFEILDMDDALEESDVFQINTENDLYVVDHNDDWAVRAILREKELRG